MTNRLDAHELRQRRLDFALLLGFVLLITLPFWLHLTNLPGTIDPDALQNLAFARIFVDAVWNHQQFPLWNPYFGGGIPWAGMVWNPGLTPFSLLLISFGEVIGYKVWFGLILFAGAMGTYLSCRDILRTSRAAALLAGLLFSGSLWAAGRLEDGNYVDFGLLLVPLCVFAFRQFLQRHWFGCLLPVLYLAILGTSRYEAFLVAGFVFLFTLLLQKQLQASYSAIVLGWLGTFGVFLILALPKLLPLLSVLDANTVNLRLASPDGLRPRMLLGSIIYSPEISALLEKYFSWDPLGYFPLPVSPRHLIGIKITALALVLSAGLLKLRQTAVLWIVLALMFLLACGPYAPLPIWRLFFVLPVFNTMLDFTKYFNVFVLFTLCGLAALGFDAVAQLLRETFGFAAKPRVQKIILGGIFVAAILHPAVYSFGINWQLYRVLPQAFIPDQFYHVASSRWLGVSNHRWRGPEPGIDEGVMYFNVQKRIGTITWYGNVAFREHATPKFFIYENGTVTRNPSHRGEVYCLTVQDANCDIKYLSLSYNRLEVNTGPSFTEPSSIILNFNYDSRWHSNQGTVVDHDGLLAVKLVSFNSDNPRIVLTYTDRAFLIGLASFMAGLVLWPVWYFRYYTVNQTRADIFSVM